MHGHSLYVKQRVPLDFSASAGPRVVSDPNEALGVAIEEESNWRVRLFTLLVTPSKNYMVRTSFSLKVIIMWTYVVNKFITRPLP